MENTNDDRFELDAQASYDEEIKGLRSAQELLAASDDDEAREKVAEEMGEPLEVSTTRCVRVLLATGGPARGYYIFIDEDGEPESGFYWYQEWLHSKRVFWLGRDELAMVVEVYSLYLGD